MSFSIRFLLALAVLAILPGAALAQSEPLRIGFLTVRTGPLAAGGKQMEDGINLFLRERNHTLSGRKVEITFADTAGQPAPPKTNAQEPVPRGKGERPASIRPSRTAAATSCRSSGRRSTRPTTARSSAS